MHILTLSRPIRGELLYSNSLLSKAPLLSSNFIHFVEYIELYWCLLKKPGVRYALTWSYENRTLEFSFGFFFVLKKLRWENFCSQDWCCSNIFLQRSPSVQASLSADWLWAKSLKPSWKTWRQEGKGLQDISHQHQQAGTTRKRICSIGMWPWSYHWSNEQNCNLCLMKRPPKCHEFVKDLGMGSSPS